MSTGVLGRYITPLLHHSITPTSPMSLDLLDCDHIRRARLLERQPGSDGDQVAAFHEPELLRLLLGVPQHRVGAMKSRDSDWVNAPNEAKSLQSRRFRRERDDWMLRPI